MPTRQGSFHLFRLFGIDVYLHWSWFLVLLYEMQVRKGVYASAVWNVLECLTLFTIVLIHEFGHQLACRSVGGQTNVIVLWPFGGVAYVSPPQRAGAQLWSIAAGPLVNVILVPILTLVWWLAGTAGWDDKVPEVYTYIESIWYINVYLLVFNMLPVYPLDGGKILRSLLWFIMGRAHSLLAASIIGFVGIAGLFVLAILRFVYSPQNGIWLGAVCVFIFMNCFQGFIQARQLLRMDKAPRNERYHCPNCHAAPPVGDFATCGKCRKKFDVFSSNFFCPHCNTEYSRVACSECGTVSSVTDWGSVTPPPPL